jgi:hypothetical protein
MAAAGSWVMELSAFTSERVSWGEGSLLTGSATTGGSMVSAAQAQAIKRTERQRSIAKNLFFMVLPPEKEWLFNVLRASLPP